MVKLINAVIVAALFLLAAPVLFAADVTFFIGTVTVQRGAKTSTVSSGEKLSPGDMVKTGPGAAVDISFADGSMIKVRENSSVRIGSVHLKGEDSFSIVTGSITGTFAKLKKGEKRISSSTVVCSVRGTEFTMDVDDAGDTRVDLKQGRVQLRNPYGTLDIEQGQRTETSVSSKPRAGSEGSSADWLKKKNSEVRRNPAVKSEEYAGYMEEFQNRNGQAAQRIDACQKTIKSARNKDDLQRADEQLSSVSEMSEDDMLLNENSQENLRQLMRDFEKEDPDAYRRFDRLRSKSEQVFRQQVRNHEMIQKIRQEYQEAYDRIMGKFRQDRDSIRRMFDKQRKDAE